MSNFKALDTLTDKHELTAEQIVILYFAKKGEGYDRIEDIPDDVLLGNAKSVEFILSVLDRFPNANVSELEAVWPSLCAVCAGRLLFY